MQAQPKLASQDFVGRSQAVTLTAFFEQRQLDLVSITLEDLPGHPYFGVCRGLEKGTGRRPIRPTPLMGGRYLPDDLSPTADLGRIAAE